MAWRSLEMIAVAIMMVTASVGLMGCEEDASSSQQPDAGPPQDASPPQDAVATPEFQPGQGTFDAPQYVTLSTATAGATIHYTMDGSPPGATSAVYTAPLTIATTTTLNAIARKSGSPDSQVRTATYTIEIRPNTVAPVQFEPNAGNYSNDVSVTLSSATPGATICYTLDDSAPACSTEARCTSGTASDGSPVPVSKTATRIRATACKSGLHDATEIHADYTLTAEKPTFDPLPGAYDPSHPVPVNLATGTKGGEIHYTTDGTTPDCTSTPSFPGKGTIPAFVTDTTVQALTCKAGYAVSEVVTMTYWGETCVGYFYVTNHTQLEALSRCTEIIGTLNIVAEDVSDLAPLSRLKRAGNVYVRTSAPTLRSLHGLEALTAVDGDFAIMFNSGLRSLDGFSSLQTVGAVFTVSGNAILEWNEPGTLVSLGGFELEEPALKRITGFAALREIRGRFDMVKCDSLTEFAGMPALTTIGGDVRFEGNAVLERVTGFPNVREVGGDFSVGADHTPLHFLAFPNLTAIKGNVSVSYANTLVELDFASLETIHGHISIFNAPALTSLQGFRNVNHVQSLLLSGALGFANLKGLEHLTTIDAGLSVSKTTDLVDLSGLENLRSAGSLRIIDTMLQSLRGLEKLTTLTSPGFGISLQDNSELTDIGSLKALTKVGGEVDLTRNARLGSLSGLRSLESVGGAFRISECNALPNLAGLEALTSIGGNLTVSFNRPLVSVDGLSALAQLGGGFSMSDNQTLPTCQPANLANRLKSGGYTGTVDIRNNRGTGTCN
ncbi:chitobiase/beta-hexosaminidase C-terminal domain-containing protein [Pendulispora rubella]|uniref:Chitobiase/beta-hexosaminidase C-terminal domain-containing protein n=1 Tax=Pendulispora rubella TaxID=2741070 RepID=A0ABZ2LCA1_9BACT